MNTLALKLESFPFARARFSKIGLFVIALILSVSLIAFYVYEITSTTVAVNDISGLEKELKVEEKQYEVSSLKLEGLTSEEKIQGKVLSQGFEKVTDTKYIKLLETTVARLSK